jgi:undecaprenyl pyrophosphate phosphatase UppP
MSSHLGMMIVFAVCVSVVFGALTREEPRDQLRMSLRILCAFVIGALVLGWAMFFAFA